MKIGFVPSCGIGYEVVNGVRVIRQNILTTVDTKIRCDEGARLFLNNKVDVLFCTGGIFLPSFLQTEPASKLMKDYLIDNYGIQPEKIWIEDRSLDSWQNIKEMKRVLQEKGIKIDKVEIVIISHWTHTIRLSVILKSYGFKKIKKHPLMYPVGWKTYVSEFLKNILTILDSRGESLIPRKEREKRSRRELSKRCW